jgi:hypothetical protein
VCNWQCAQQSELQRSSRCDCAITLGIIISGYVIYKGSHDRYGSGNPQKQLVVASCARPSRDNLSHRCQWSTLVVKNDRVVQTWCRRCTSRILFKFSVQDHSHNEPNIVLWSSLPLLPHSQSWLLTVHVPGVYLFLFSIAIYIIV